MEKSSIKADDSYIYVNYFRRLLSASLAMTLSFILFVFAGFFIGELFAVKIAADMLPIISFVLSMIIFIITYYSEVIIKRLAMRWGINELELFENRAKLISIFAILGASSFVLFNLVFSANDFWAIIMPFYAFVSLVLLILFFVVNPFTNFYSTKGRIVIGLSNFVASYESNADSADFYTLLIASKNISKIAKLHNMDIDSYKLCLGISVACIQNPVETENNLKNLSFWAQKPRDKTNFTEFQILVNKYMNIAKDSADYGISEKTHLTFESKTIVLNVLVIPVLVCLLAVLIPKLLEILGV